MSLSISGYVVLILVIGAPLSALAGFIFAARRKSIHVPDFATPVVPALMFVAVGSFRTELLTGWAMVLWPLFIMVVSMYALSAKHLVIDRHIQRTKRTSSALLAVLMLGSFILSVSVPQLLE